MFIFISSPLLLHALNDSLDSGYSLINVSDVIEESKTTIYFNHTFSTPPKVVVGGVGFNRNALVATLVEDSITTTSFKVYGYYSGGTGKAHISWIAYNS